MLMPKDFSGDILCGNWSNDTTILRTIPIITHHEEVIIGNSDRTKITIDGFFGSIVSNLCLSIYIENSIGNLNSISGEANNSFDIEAGVVRDNALIHFRVRVEENNVFALKIAGGIYFAGKRNISRLKSRNH